VVLQGLQEVACVYGGEVLLPEGDTEVLLAVGVDTEPKTGSRFSVAQN
jgi:hypothetical protein